MMIGGAGFIGKAVIARLIVSPKVNIISLTARKDARNDQTVYVDYQDEGSLISIFEKARPDVIVHLASSCVRDNSAQGLEQGLRRDETILKALRGWTEPLKVIFFSSMACFAMSDTAVDGNKMSPSTFYGQEKVQMVKALTELVARNANIALKVIIPSSVYGAGQDGKMFLPSLLEHFRRGEKMIAFGSKKRRDFINVTDVADFTCRTILLPNWPLAQTTFLHSGELYELGRVAQLACNVAGIDYNDAISFVDSDKDHLDTQRLAVGILSRSAFHPSISLESGVREMFGDA